MDLISLNRIQLGFGGPLILDKLNLTISDKERLCLIGRNGAGKSTLLKIISGAIKPDEGEVIRSQQLRVAYLDQNVPSIPDKTIYQVVAQGLGPLGDYLTEYEQISLSESPNLDRLAQLQDMLDHQNGWTLQQNISEALSRLELNGELLFNELSGGQKRRVLLAKALVNQPNLLLLDEPTNHLDIESIHWLEQFLKNYSGSVLLITHDRAFLQALATRIIELDRGQLNSHECDYQTYLIRKQEELNAQTKQWSEEDKKLAQEEVWIRQGIKARRTRNEGRVRALQALREQRQQRRDNPGQVKLTHQVSNASAKLVIEAKHIKIQYDPNRPALIDNFSTRIVRGDKIALIGPNGVGKTSLIKVLLAQQTPTVGDVTLGERLQIAYFDQMRAQFDEEKSLRDNVGEGSDQVIVNGQPRHIIGYLQDFLFSPQRANTPVKALSGGERNRLLLARLFTKPSNLLVLDEPTNDLDLETLELLESLLVDYQGTLLVVSHDRSFIDNIATSSIVFEGNGQIEEYVGGYTDWLRQKKLPSNTTTNQATTKTAENKSKEKSQKKLSYKEQQELLALPKQIEKLELEMDTLQSQFADPNFYQRDAGFIAEQKRKFAELELKMETAFARWQILE